MRSIAFFTIGLGFILMAAGLYALTLRKGKELPAMPTKTQLREQAALAAENRKMRLAAGIAAGFGALICVVFIF